MICLDTNVAIGLLNEKPPVLLERFWKEASGDTICLPIIVLFELRYGVAKSEHRQRNAQRLEDLFTFPLSLLRFEKADAEHAADIRSDLKREGTPIGPYDVLIAAQARSRGATLVTANTREFARVPRLALDDWTAASL